MRYSKISSGAPAVWYSAFRTTPLPPFVAEFHAATWYCTSDSRFVSSSSWIVATHHIALPFWLESASAWLNSIPLVRTRSEASTFGNASLLSRDTPLTVRLLAPFVVMR